MKLAIEVSLYPLDQNYIPYIKDFIERVNTYPELTVNTTHTSTLVSGDYDALTLVNETDETT